MFYTRSEYKKIDSTVFFPIFDGIVIDPSKVDDILAVFSYQKDKVEELVKADAEKVKEPYTIRAQTTILKAEEKASDVQQTLSRVHYRFLTLFELLSLVAQSEQAADMTFHLVVSLGDNVGVATVETPVKENRPRVKLHGGNFPAEKFGISAGAQFPLVRTQDLKDVQFSKE